METRVALIAIIVENTELVSKLNSILSEYSEYIIGRMGVPYKEKGLNVISVAIDAPQSVTSAISGKIGSLSGITAKTVYAGKKQ